MLYTVQVTLKVSAESEHEAYSFVKHALDNARKAELVYVDSEVIDHEDDADDAPIEAMSVR
jgi:hypothetical protein